MKRSLPSWILLVGLAALGCATGEEASPDDAGNDFGIDLISQDTGSDMTTGPADQMSPSDTPGADTTPSDTTSPPDTVADTTVPDMTAPDTATDMAMPDTASDVTTPDVINGGVADLGKACGPTDQCSPGTASWPGCADFQCESGNCIFGLDDSGFCSNGCLVDADCGTADAASITGTSFKCISNGTNPGFCMPGSNTACTATEECPTGEACKLGFETDDAGLLLSSTCQTKTAGGSPPGGACNMEIDQGPIEYCENGMCFGTRCSSFCSAGGAGSTCGGNTFACEPDVSITQDGSFVRDLCLGRECDNSAECTAPGYQCAPLSTFGTPPDEYLAGRCSYATRGLSASNGATCTDDDQCTSGWCLVGQGETEGVCTSMCDDVSQCGSNQRCMAVIIPSPDESYLQGVSLCIEVEGSRTSCNGDTDCSNGEVCDFYIVGDRDDANPREINGFPVTECGTSPNPQGADMAGSCTSSADCKNSICVDFGSGGQCTSPCQSTSHCTNGFECRYSIAVFDGNDGLDSQSGGMNDISITACGPAAP